MDRHADRSPVQHASLVQAFVIPTGSMEDTLLVGDHVLVDKLSYAPPGRVTNHLLPYEDVHRGDIVIFRFPPISNRRM